MTLDGPNKVNVELSSIYHYTQYIMSEIITLFYFYILCKLLVAKAYLYPLHAIKACQPGVNHNNSQCHMHHSQLCWHATLINNATLQVEMNQFCNSPKIGAEIWHNS